MAVHCPVCDAENPDNGRFCIECGATLRQSAVGSTERLPEVGGKQCPSCGVANPAHASFCVNCGRALEAQPAAPRPVASASPVFDMPRSPSPMAAPARRWASQPNPALWGSISGGVFMIGLAILFLTGWFWPGILVLIGVTGLLGSIASGQPKAGAIGAVWMIGLALLFTSGWIWPGVLILIGGTIIVKGLMDRM